MKRYLLSAVAFLAAACGAAMAFCIAAMGAVSDGLRFTAAYLVAAIPRAGAVGGGSACQPKDINPISLHAAKQYQRRKEQRLPDGFAATWRTQPVL